MAARWTGRLAVSVLIIAAAAAGVSAQINPVNKVIVNSQTLADGSIDPTRLTPRTAGFGAATGAQPMRSILITARFSF